MYEDILLPTDGSEGTEEAIEHALAIATDRDATVHGLYVLDRRLYTAANDGATEEVHQSLEDDGDRALAAVRGAATTADVDIVTEQRDGIPHRAILEYAADVDADLIVMGTHGRTGPDRIANLGSTTERVVKNGDHPVLVVDIE